MIDTTAEHSALQPENAIVIKPWEGKGGERGLVDLIPFLECTLLPLGIPTHATLLLSVECCLYPELMNPSDRYFRTA